MNGISALRPSLSSRLKVCWILDMDGYKLFATPSGNPDRGAKSELDAGLLGNGVHVLVATTRQIHKEDLVLRERRSELGSIG